MRVMSLRLSDAMHESLRREAFERRVSMNDVIRDAIERRRSVGALGCDVCGNDEVVHVSTPGGIRYCSEHHRSPVEASPDFGEGDR